MASLSNINEVVPIDPLWAPVGGKIHRALSSLFFRILNYLGHYHNTRQLMPLDTLLYDLGAFSGFPDKLSEN